VIIKAAKRIFNSDKICRSYCDFYFGVTFLEHTVYENFTTVMSLDSEDLIRLWSTQRYKNWKKFNAAIVPSLLPCCLCLYWLDETPTGAVNK